MVATATAAPKTKTQIKKDKKAAQAGKQTNRTTEPDAATDVEGRVESVLVRRSRVGLERSNKKFMDVYATLVADNRLNYVEAMRTIGVTPQEVTAMFTRMRLVYMKDLFDRLETWFKGMDGPAASAGYDALDSAEQADSIFSFFAVPVLNVQPFPDMWGPLTAKLEDRPWVLVQPFDLMWGSLVVQGLLSPEMQQVLSMKDVLQMISNGEIEPELADAIKQTCRTTITTMLPQVLTQWFRFLILPQYIARYSGELPEESAVALKAAYMNAPFKEIDFPMFAPSVDPTVSPYSQLRVALPSVTNGVMHQALQAVYTNGRDLVNSIIDPFIWSTAFYSNVPQQLFMSQQDFSKISAMARRYGATRSFGGGGAPRAPQQAQPPPPPPPQEPPPPTESEQRDFDDIGNMSRNPSPVPPPPEPRPDRRTFAQRPYEGMPMPEPAPQPTNGTPPAPPPSAARRSATRGASTRTTASPLDNMAARSQSRHVQFAPSVPLADGGDTSALDALLGRAPVYQPSAPSFTDYATSILNAPSIGGGNSSNSSALAPDMLSNAYGSVAAADVGTPSNMSFAQIAASDKFSKPLRDMASIAAGFDAQFGNVKDRITNQGQRDEIANGMNVLERLLRDHPPKNDIIGSPEYGKPLKPVIAALRKTIAQMKRTLLRGEPNTGTVRRNAIMAAEGFTPQQIEEGKFGKVDIPVYFLQGQDYTNQGKALIDQVGLNPDLVAANPTMGDVATAAGRQAKFGKSAGEATLDQLIARRQTGFSGSGVYNSHTGAYDMGNATYGAGARPAFGDRGEFEGNGGYWGNWLGNRLPYVGGAAAGAALSDLENKAINWGMGKLQQAATGYTGSGAYYTDQAFDRRGVKRPRDESDDVVIVNNPTGGRLETNQIVDPGNPYARKPPRIYSVEGESGDIVFSHNEYIGDLTPQSSDFETQYLFNINAGLHSSFPLLARFATYFEEYEFEQLLIKYRSIITPGNATAAGSVMLATMYNPSSSQFYSKRAIENSEYSASGKVTDEIVMGVECAKGKNAISNILYTRYGELPPSVDLHTYDMGFVQISTQGCSPGLCIGEVWATYTCRLKKLRNMTQVPLAIGDGVLLECSALNPVTETGWQLQATALASQQTFTGSTEIQFPCPDWNSIWDDTTDGLNLNARTGGGYFRSPWPNAMIAGFSCSPNLSLQQTLSTVGDVPTFIIKFTAVPAGEYILGFTFTGATAYDSPAQIQSNPAAPTTFTTYNLKLLTGSATLQSSTISIVTGVNQLVLGFVNTNNVATMFTAGGQTRIYASQKGGLVTLQVAANAWLAQTALKYFINTTQWYMTRVK